MSAVCYIGTNFHGNIKVIGAMTRMRRDNCICHLYSLENAGPHLAHWRGLPAGPGAHGQVLRVPAVTAAIVVMVVTRAVTVTVAETL